MNRQRFIDALAIGAGKGAGEVTVLALALLAYYALTGDNLLRAAAALVARCFAG